MPSYLIKGGNVLQWDANKNATFPQLDVLVEGQRISKIGPNLEGEGANVEVIDALDCIVSPGLIDGHRHVFQSQLRTTVANATLLEYCSDLLQGRMTFLDADDMYISQLSGTTEALWCGVTTVMDHSHVVTSPERAEKCIKATIESGIRSIYCVATFALPSSLNPMVFPDMDVQHAEQIALFKKLSAEKPLGGPSNDGRVTLGLGYDTINHRSMDEARGILQYAKDNDITVTFHDVERFNLSSLETLRTHNLPLPKITLSHTCDPDETRVNFVKENGIGVVSTPESELSMSHGYPAAFQLQRAGCRVGLGVDSPAICSGDIFFAMRLALQNQRGRTNAEYHARGKVPDKIREQVDDVLYMGTLGGAEAVHRDADIGSIEPGKFADIIIIRTDSPSMVSSVNLGAAMVTNTHASDVSTVMVNGEIVKKDGKMLRVNWDELKTKLRENRKKLEPRWKDVDFAMSKRELKGFWYLQDVME
ncbi:Metallo-dependent hydrolase [Rhizodiscina lignyota]|uniref:Metallo-dependent hydrolase n=1 Tax=Rhizodiscina lignyota TaxID=1504668 RepID=A0A9P4M9R5_9PEZI|nr:Metallo-dependent hydrolase [Rhizodiscina lignyota]